MKIARRSFSSRQHSHHIRIIQSEIKEDIGATIAIESYEFQADTSSSKPKDRTGWFLTSERIKLLNLLKEPFLLACNFETL